MKRIEYIDTAKAFTILIVIVGHTVYAPIRAIFFSFHMPLFFIYSAWTTNFSGSKTQFNKKIQKGYKTLIQPALIIFFTRFVLQFFQIMITENHFDWKDFLFKKALSLLFSSGVDYIWFNIQIPAIGISWFFIVLFLTKTIYDCLQLVLKGKYLFIVSFLLSLSGVILGRRMFLFFSLDIALAVVLLIWVSQFGRQHYVPGNSSRLAFLSLVLWGICFSIPFILNLNAKNYLEFATRDYPLFPICYLGAISATIFITEICYVLNNVHFISRFLKAFNYLGRNTRYMIYVHCFDDYWKAMYTFTSNDYVNSVFRILADIIVFFILMHVRKAISKLYSKRDESLNKIPK